MVEVNLGAKMDELMQHVSRVLGYRSTSAQLRDVIEGQAKRLVENGTLRWRGDHLIPAKQ